MTTLPMPSGAHRGGVALFVLRGIGRLPLRALRTLGAMLGWIAYAASPGYRRKIRSNLRRAGLDARAMRWRVAGESGRRWANCRGCERARWRRSPRASTAVPTTIAARGRRARRRGCCSLLPTSSPSTIAARWNGRALRSSCCSSRRRKTVCTAGAFARDRDAIEPCRRPGRPALVCARCMRGSMGLLPDQVPMPARDAGAVLRELATR